MDHAQALLEAFEKNPDEGTYSFPVRDLADMGDGDRMMLNIVVKGFVESNPGITLESSHSSTSLMQDTISISWRKKTS